MARRSPGSTILPSVGWTGISPELRVGGQTVDVVRRHRLAHAGQVQEPGDDRRGALDLLGGARQGDRVAPEADPHAERALQLLEVAVVYSREEQRIGAFGRQALLDVVGHSG